MKHRSLKSRTGADLALGSARSKSRPLPKPPGGKVAGIKENKSGQSLGSKGRRTRERVIATTRMLLEASGGQIPAVAAIARAAKISAPTFYLYFEEVGEIILSVLQQMENELEPVIELLAGSWPTEECYDHARAFVTAYFVYWTKHAALLRVRNRLADEGDKRFVILRTKSVGHLTAILASKLVLPVTQGRVIATREEMAIVLICALERSATVLVLGLYPNPTTDGRRNPLINPLAQLIATVMGPTLTGSVTRVRVEKAQADGSGSKRGP
jgi:AcrR family transcriptional regulator